LVYLPIYDFTNEDIWLVYLLLLHVWNFEQHLPQNDPAKYSIMERTGLSAENCVFVSGFDPVNSGKP
jgi:uncharacterized protein YdaU (DUF1376 family)